MNNEQIVNKIKSICKEHDITITKLEETLGMSQGLISRWNKSDPSLSKIIDIANYFNISLDDLTGYRNIINDQFIEKLLLQTSNKTLKWHNYGNSDNIPKQYCIPSNNLNFYTQEEEIEYFNTHNELSYYTPINKGFISIYACYEFDKVKAPSEIKLFIQPDENASLVFQDYTKEQLISLWLKVLFTLNEEAPDVIKAEELKNIFINDIDTSSSYKNFKNADLTGADFSGADLSRSKLIGANLIGANLYGANLTGANLCDANLTSAILCDANLTNTVLMKS